MKPTNNVARVRGLALCCIPKCANSSIKWALLEALGVPLQERRQRHSALCLGTPTETGDLYTAAFLRFPAARLYSCWHDKVRQQKGKASRRLVSMGFRIGMPFGEFVEQVISQRCDDLHLRPQVDFLAPKMDFVGTVELFDAHPAHHWMRLQERFPWLPDIGRENVSANDNWRRECSQALLSRINEYYAADYELWGAAQSGTFL